MTPPEVLSFRDHGGSTWNIRVVPNKYPAVGMQAHEVIIESPDHNCSLGGQLFEAARERILYWKQEAQMQYVQFFKNSGEAAGASLEHPHSQLLALPLVPRRVSEELHGAHAYFAEHGHCFFCDEPEDRSRLIFESDQMRAIVPCAPRFDFETWIIPVAHTSHFENSQPETVSAIHSAVQVVIDKLNEAVAYPAYNLILHTAPLHQPELSHYHWHLEVLPRLTGIAGFELATGCYITSGHTLLTQRASGNIR